MMSTRKRRSRSSKTKDQNTLFVTVKGSKLPHYITGQHLKEHFEQFEDDIVTSRVWREKDPIKSKGYAFIEFTSSTVASEAMRTLQGSHLRDKFPLLLKYARRKRDCCTPVCASDSDSETDSESDSSSATLYVSVFNSKFPNYINSGHLQQHFSEFQHCIENAMIVRDRETKETKGFGFVTLTSHAAAELAMKKLRGSRLLGKFKLFISFRKDSRSTTPSLTHSRASSTFDLLSSSFSHSSVSSTFDPSSCCTDDIPGDQGDSACTLYVGVHKSKFPNHINSRHLQSHFSEFQEHIKRAIIVRDMKTKESKGFGIVTFSSHHIAETAMKKLRGSKLNGKFSLLLSLKDKMKHSSTADPVVAEKSLVPLIGTTEELLYLRYRFYVFPTVVSSAIKESLPAQLVLRDSILYLSGTENAIRRSTSQIHASMLVQKLQSRDFSGTWDQCFVVQLRDYILPPINKSEQDILCILTEKQEQHFTVHLFSHSIIILQEIHQKLIELKPQSKLFQLRPEFTTVSGLTDTFLSFGKDHCTKIDKETGQGVRIHGLKSEDVLSCWAALKSFVDSKITVTLELYIGFWQAKYVQSKCSNIFHTLEAEGCKIKLPVVTTKQLQDKVKVVLTGSLKTTKQSSDKIKDICSRCQVQSVKLTCSEKYFNLWMKQWKKFVEEHEKEKGNLIIEFHHQHQPAGNQVVEFTIVGTDSSSVAQVKRDIVLCKNGSKDKLAKLDIVLSAADFVLASKFLSEIETKLTQTYDVLVILELDSKKSIVQLLTAPCMSHMLSKLQTELICLIASKAATNQKSISKQMKFKDEVIGSLLTSRTKHFAKLEREGDMLHVNVQPDQSNPDAFNLKLVGSGANVRAVELTLESLVKDLTASIKHTQLVLGAHNLSIMCTDSFKKFCSKLLMELHVKCIYYPPVGGDLLRQVQLSSKSGCLLTLQIAVAHLCDERVDAIVIPAESRDKTMTNVEMNFDYFRFLQKKTQPSDTGEVACIDSGTFPSNKALHVFLPRSCEQVERQVEFVTACRNTLNYASSKQLCSLSFPALGVDDVHKISATLCIDTLLYSVDKHCSDSDDTTLHTVRIVITQDLSTTVLSCFDKYKFGALQRKEATHLKNSQCLTASPSQYEWYWEDDKKKITKYSSDVSKALTQAKLTIPNKSCLFEVNGKSYIVNLSTMTQKNVSTGFTRKVICKEMPPESNLSATCRSSSGNDPQSSEVQWYYKDDKAKFTAYSQSDSTKIENMYQEVSSVSKYLCIQSRVYRLDFENMMQVNISTKYQRDIKREEVPRRQQYEADFVGTEEDESPRCVINLRGPVDSLQRAEKMVKYKLESLTAFKNVPLPAASTPALKKKLCSIARRHSVSSSIKDDSEEKPILSSAQQRRFSQVIRIEGAEHFVDKAVTEVQGEIIEFHSQSSSSSLSQLGVQYPSDWELQTSTSQLFDLEKYNREWIRVTSLFRDTMPDAEIISVRRIQNKWLWGKYNQQKDRMREKNNGLVNEKELWHGSRKSSADNIHSSEEGFDMRYSSEGLWGQANYFAEKASYSDKYAFTSAGGTKELLLAKVLTGDSFESQSDGSLRMPPEKPGSSQSGNVQLKQLRYDSVNGTTCNCRVYMTYANDKAYPAYLICYSSTPTIIARIRQASATHVHSSTRSARMAALLASFRKNAQYTGFTQ